MGQSSPQLHIVIFSKDRAMQADSLLRSIRDHLHVPVASVRILYKASDDSYARAYDIIARENMLPSVEWVKETIFSDDVRQIIAGLDDGALVMFLVDDDIVRRPFSDRSLLDRLSRKHLFISLRCSRSYAADTPPAFLHTNGYLEWRWNYSKKHWVTWNYPFSVDGHIYNVKVIRKVLRCIKFKAPNSLEGNMHRYRHAWWIKWTPLGLSPTEPVVYNNPLNKVQTEGETWNQEISAEALNRKFLDGYRIDNQVLYDAQPASTHTPVELRFIKTAERPG